MQLSGLIGSGGRADGGLARRGIDGDDPLDQPGIDLMAGVVERVERDDAAPAVDRGEVRMVDGELRAVIVTSVNGWNGDRRISRLNSWIVIWPCPLACVRGLPPPMPGGSPRRRLPTRARFDGTPLLSDLA